MGKNVIIIAGPNGAGKTTFAKEYLKEHDMRYISADLMAEQLSTGDIREVALEAGKQFFAELDNSIEARDSFIVESTLSGLGFRRIIDKLKQYSYTVSIIFVYVETPEICITRIRERTRKGGHPVPDDDVIRRFYRSIFNFWQLYKNEAERWFLICNSSQHIIEVAFGSRDDYSISDEQLYNTFKGLVKAKR